jgi:hypothetical protein
LAFFGVRACWIAVVGGNPRTPFFRCAWPGCSAWLSSARGRAVCCVVVGREPRTPLLRFARTGRCARPGLLKRASELDCRSWGRPPDPLFRCDQPCRSAQLGHFQRECELNCRSREIPPQAPSSAALGLATALEFGGGQTRETNGHVRRFFNAMASQRRGCFHGARFRPLHCSS